MKRVLAVFLSFVFILGLLSSVSFAAYKDIPSNASYKSSVERLNKLGIMVYKNKFSPNSFITRGEFAQIIVTISNLNDQASLYKGYSQYPDIKANTQLAGCVNLVVQKKFMTPLADNKFHPSDALTFAQATTALVRMLGYSDSDLSGIWPQNYIDKAMDLGLIKGLSLSPSQKVPRWAMALMLDRLLDTYVKSANANDTAKKFYESTGLFKEYIVLDTSKTSSKLLSNEILTDSGILLNTTTFNKFEVGKKYMLKIENGQITKVYGEARESRQFVSTKNDNKVVYYISNNKTYSFALPANATYYYNETKQSYDSIANVLKPNQQIVLGYTKDKSQIEYVVIRDLYDQDTYGSYDEVIVLDTPQTSSELDKNQVQTDKGIYYVAQSVYNKLDVGAKYGVYIKDDTITAIAQKIWNAEVWKIKSISDYTVVLEQNDKTKTLNLTAKPSYYYQGAKQTYENLKSILKTDQSLYISKDIETEKYMAFVIQDPYGSQYGSYSEVVVFANGLSSSSLEPNQVLTDKGIYYLPDTNTKLDIGAKYGVYIKDDKITLVVKKLNKVDNAEITNVVSATNVKLKGLSSSQNIVLPQKPTYYYNGTKQSYDSLKNILKAGQKVYFGYNNDGTAYEYVLIQDPYDETYGTYTEVIVMADAVTSSKLSTNEVLTDKGVYAVDKNAGKLTVGAKYGVYIKNDVITKVLKKLNNVDNSEVISVISGTNVKIQKGNTQENLILPQKPTYYYNGTKQSYDNLKSLLKTGQRIYFGYNADGTSYEYAIIQDPYEDSYGTYNEIIVMGNSTVNRSLQSNEILTDKGTLILPQNASQLTLGAKYGVYVDSNNEITLVYKKFNSIDTATVIYALGGKITVDKSGNKQDITLPQNISYYYNGSKIDYLTALQKIQRNTSLVFGMSSQGNGYDYCVIFDPVYSKPYLADSMTYSTLKAGDLDISGSVQVVKDGDIVDYSYISKDDVVYAVTDIWGNNRFILVISEKIEAYIKKYDPTRFTPKNIVVSVYDTSTQKLVEKTYEVSEDFDTSVLLSDTFKIGQRVYLILGYDGKVVSMVSD